MPINVADLLARLRLDASGFKPGAQEAGRETDKLSGSFKLSVRSLAALSAGLAAATFVAKKLTDAFAQNALQIRAIQSVSGLGAEAADNLADSFDLLGLDSNALSFAMFRLGQQIDEGGDAIHRMGLTLRDAAGGLKTEGALFLEVRDRIAAMGTASERSAALVELFGRAGRQLAPAFALSRTEFEALTAKAAELSPMTEEMQKRALEMVQATNAMAKAWEGFKLQLGDLVSRVATPVLNFLADMIIALREGKHVLDEFAAFGPQPPGPPAAERLREPSGGAKAPTPKPPFLGKPLFTADELKAQVAKLSQASAELELALREGMDEESVRALDMAMEDLAQATDRVTKAREDLEAALQGEGLERLELEAEAAAKAFDTAVSDTMKKTGSFWQEQLQAIKDSAAQTWSALSLGFSSALAGVIQGTKTMKEFFQSALNTILQAAIQLGVQLLANWLMQTAFKQTQDAAMVATHTAMESAKTAVTTAQEAARTGIVLAANKVMLGATAASLTAMGGVGLAAMTTMEAVVAATAGVLAAIGAALAATVVGAPLAPAYFAAAAAVSTAGTAAVAAGAAAIAAAITAASATVAAALAIPSLDEGGLVLQDTAAVVHKGEVVAPLDRLAGAAGRGMEQTIFVMLGEREIAKAMVTGMPDVVRVRAGLRGA